MRKFFTKLQKINLKKTSLISLIVLIIVVGGIFSGKKFFKQPPKEIYEVAVMVRDQNNSNPAEDRKTSLKAGDVLVIQKQGHSWSKTEKVSYLILKMKLSEEEARKLIKPAEKSLSKKEAEKELKKTIEDRDNITKEEKESLKEEIKQRREVIIAREYRVKISELDFKPVDLLVRQPFMDAVYDWNIVEKKKTR